MYRYSEAPFVITTDRTDLSQCTEIHVTFAQGSTIVDKTGTAVSVSDDGTTLTTRMTQEEAAGFNTKNALLAQVTLLDPDGYRRVSDIQTLSVGASLLDQTIGTAAAAEEETPGPEESAEEEAT